MGKAQTCSWSMPFDRKLDVQVGKDQSAQAFLGQLDRDPQVGSMIDCVSDYELEQEEYKRKGIDLTPEVYLVKLMIGACDRSYDEGDECEPLISQPHRTASLWPLGWGCLVKDRVN